MTLQVRRVVVEKDGHTPVDGPIRLSGPVWDGGFQRNQGTRAVVEVYHRLVTVRDLSGHTPDRETHTDTLGGVGPGPGVSPLSGRCTPGPTKLEV